MSPMLAFAFGPQQIGPANLLKGEISMVTFVLALALANLPPDIEKRLGETTTMTLREAIAHQCITTAGNGKLLTSALGGKWSGIRADTTVVLSGRDEKVVLDPRLTMTFSGVDIDALIKSRILNLVRTSVGFCIMKAANLWPPTTLNDNAAAQDRWRDDLVDTTVAFRVDNGNGSFQYLRFDGASFARAPSPTP